MSGSSVPASPGSDRASTLLAWLAFGYVAAWVLFLSAGPIVTDDLWWHLAMGEVYASVGPWPDGDPLLHTAHSDAPVQHEWLFGVAVHCVDRALGFHGLRVLHGLAVAAIGALVLSMLRRASRDTLAALLGATIFAVLAWWRLFQLRPDLVSIPAAILTWRLLLEPEEPPSWRRVTAFVGLCVVWVNMHSLFAIGLLLAAAGATGIAAQGVLLRVLHAAPSRDLARALRIAVAAGAGALASLVNPRGIAQYLTFFTSSAESAIWRVHDEWTAFDPFQFAFTSEAVSRLAWVTADILLVALLVVAGFEIIRFARERSEESLRALDLPTLAVAIAGVAALLVSVRFLWMAVFPLLYLGRAWARAGAPAPTVWQRSAALATLLLALALAPFGNVRLVAKLQSDGAAEWLTTPYVRSKYHTVGVRFLRDAALEGNLFNKVPMGGFLGYWLAPDLRTYVDSRTEHYTRKVLSEYSMINVAGKLGGENFGEILERREVDLFFGTGPPTGIWRDATLFTGDHPDPLEGWIPVSRSVHHTLWLRTHPRNAENLRRISAWYRNDGISFDPQRGFDAPSVLRSNPEWAIAHELAPPDWVQLDAARRAGDPDAADRVALVLALLGDYEAQLAIDAEILAARPNAPGARRRTVYALLRLGRRSEALKHARELESRAPTDPTTRGAVAVARAAMRQGSNPTALTQTLMHYPLVDTEESAWLAAHFHTTRLD